MPPATATSRSPARTAWSTIPAERMPDAHTLFTVSEETSLGMPPLIWACREGTCPCPACSTWPNTTCSTWSGATSARCSACSMAWPPRSVAPREASAPPIFPKGVRAVPRITVLGMVERVSLLLRGAGDDTGAALSPEPLGPWRVVDPNETISLHSATAVLATVGGLSQRRRRRRSRGPPTPQLTATPNPVVSGRTSP